jgi:hypothetical protein
MKTLFFLVILVLITGVLSAQDSIKHSHVVIGLYTNIGINQPFPIKRSTPFGGSEKLLGRGSYSAGIMFTKPIGQKYEISVAAVYSVHKVGLRDSPFFDYNGGTYTENFEVFNVPITLKRYLKNNYFLTLGTIIDFDVPRNSQFIGPQTGFGLKLGCGKEIHIKNFTLDISPNLEMHTILPFQPRETEERLLVLGIRIGLSNYCP